MNENGGRGPTSREEQENGSCSCKCNGRTIDVLYLSSNDLKYDKDVGQSKYGGVLRLGGEREEMPERRKETSDEDEDSAEATEITTTAGKYTLFKSILE